MAKVENETVVGTLRRTYERCVADKPNVRRKACEDMLAISRDVHRLADMGDTAKHDPAALREMATACTAVASAIKLADARDYAELMRKPHMVEAVRRVKWALEA